MPESSQPFVFSGDVGIQNVRGKIYYDKPGIVSTTDTPGKPEAFAATEARVKQVNMVFNPIFDVIGISGAPGTMGNELRAKLVNDLMQTKSSDAQEIKAAIMQSLKEFKDANQDLMDLRGKGFTEQHIGMLIAARLIISSSKAAETPPQSSSALPRE